MIRAGLRIAVCAIPALAGAAAVAGSRPASAQATNFRQEFDDIKNAIPGLGQPRAPIDFTERAPLVVPPTNDLPPPVDAAPRLGVEDPDAINRTEARSDPRRPVPADDPGASATGLDARTYLIEPPSGMRNPAAVSGAAAEDGFKDAPKKKKSAQAPKHVRRTPAVATAQ